MTRARVGFHGLAPRGYRQDALRAGDKGRGFRRVHGWPRRVARAGLLRAGGPFADSHVAQARGRMVAQNAEPPQGANDALQVAHASERGSRPLGLCVIGRATGCFHDFPAVERAVFGQCIRWHWLGTYTQ